MKVTISYNAFAQQLQASRLPEAEGMVDLRLGCDDRWKHR